MKCDRAQQLWHDQRDGEAAPEDQAALATHLQECSACRSYHRELDQTDAALNALRLETAFIGSQPAQQRPNRALTAPYPPRVFRIWRAVRIAAAVGLAVGAGLYWSGNGSGPPPAEFPSLSPELPSPEPPPVAEPAAAAQVSLTDGSAEEFIAVQRPSSRSNVHVYWLYRTGGNKPSLE